MPMYDFECPAHGRFEDLAKPAEVKLCPECGSVAVRQVGLPAKTASLWNGGWNSGLSGDGFYSYSAGRRVSSKREEEKIMNSRGFVNLKDLGGEAFEDSFAAAKLEEARQHEAVVSRYTENLKTFGGDKLRATVETFPAKEMLAQSEA